MQGKQYSVHVKDTGETFPCGENEFLLAAMVRSSCGPIRYGCHGGGCGICKMQIEQGEFDIVKPMSRAHVSVQEQEHEQSKVLLCCVQPRGNLVISRVE